MLRRPLVGALVVEVVPGSPAAQAGLQPSERGRFGEIIIGDLITAVDGVPIEQVAGRLRAHRACMHACAHGDGVAVEPVAGRLRACPCGHRARPWFAARVLLRCRCRIQALPNPGLPDVTLP